MNSVKENGVVIVTIPEERDDLLSLAMRRMLAFFGITKMHVSLVITKGLDWMVVTVLPGGVETEECYSIIKCIKSKISG